MPIKKRMYTKHQSEFHDMIDRLMSLMSANMSTAPQINRGRARDVHKLITIDFSKYFNPSNPRWLFKESIVTDITLQKLNHVNNQLTNYCKTKVPIQYTPYCYELKEYIKAAIKKL